MNKSNRQNNANNANNIILIKYYIMSSLQTNLGSSQQNSNLFSLIENVSLYSPLIIVIGILLCSLFSANIAKGATFVVCAIIATSLRDTLLKMNNYPTISTPMTTGGSKKRVMKGGTPGKCDMGIKIFGDDSTLGIYMLMFSMSYICAPMFIIGHINF